LTAIFGLGDVQGKVAIAVIFHPSSVANRSPMLSTEKRAICSERCIKDALALEALVDAVLRLPDLYFEDPGMNSIPSYRLITLIQNARKAAKNIRHK